MRLLLGLMWCLHFLPLPILGRFGEAIGSIFYWILPSRRHITKTNLRLCFPELSEAERTTIAKQHFQAYARSVFERSILWWSSEQRVRKLIRVEPAVPTELIAAGPVILLCPHFVSLDVAGIGLVLETPICSIYAPQKNAVFDEALKNGRNRFGLVRLLSRAEGVKPIIRAMREGYGFLMLPDMDFGIKDAEFVPFFGIPAATLTAPARIAAATNAKVVPVIATMLPNYQGWRVTVHPAWENFPGDDIVAATQYMNTFLEEQIRLTPAEYFWSHRRFKTRPEGAEDLYK
ncbi:lipid A biosynthesis acyltransferase [Solimicrobium silvestre]|uniref:Lauroyl/myristoyl acyltransferase n=1 Tax=Solimicrobium silvestre TaxID=2099400 RepID=A0A2S9H389_9BURK|nr:lipid A biosynthesis acyltransferase [Solimicrobium silvestre]PRC94441.1 Lauroyl/myristoyl acyltransferase [Solimicrobium silvestre]